MCPQSFDVLTTAPAAGARGAAVRIIGTVPVSGSTGSTPFNTATKTQTSASLTSQTLLAANASRTGGALIRNNDPAANLYMSLGAGAATVANAAYVIPPGETRAVAIGFTGAVSGIWADAAVTGASANTEFSA